MADDAARPDARYWAFISYSHQDAAFGRSLHRRLESYALPRRLVGRAIGGGVVPRRLAPIFRDREEFAAAHDLSAEVRAALKASRSLIVVCSPAAASSRWVDREVQAFREFHPDAPVLAAMRAGEPADAFPPSLYRIGGDDAPLEPLAADFRRGRDGGHLGLLKLVAGILGLGLDELVQRDAHRRNQRVTAVTAGALAVALMMSLLAVFAVNARTEAERQRGEAEGLVEFMLTDLRTRLKGVGRLDVMTAVNERALRYYSDKDLRALPVDSLERRARIFHAMGEDDETRGDEDAALAKFTEARRTTAALLAEAPDDPERIFAQAQSEFWIGHVDYDRGRMGAAKIAFLEYKRLADRLVAIAPDNARYRLEVGEADSDLCALSLIEPIDTAAALRFCADSLMQTEKAAHRLGASREIVDDLIDRHAWLADAYRASGDIARAKAERLTEEKMLGKEIAADPKNMDLKDTWVALQRALAKLEIQAGDRAAANARLEKALTVVGEMIAFDPTNNEWAKSKARIVDDLSNMSNAMEKGASHDKH